MGRLDAGASSVILTLFVTPTLSESEGEDLEGRKAREVGEMHRAVRPSIPLAKRSG